MAFSAQSRSLPLLALALLLVLTVSVPLPILAEIQVRRVSVVTDLEKLYGSRFDDTSYRLGFANISVEVCGKAKDVHLETLNASVVKVLRSDVIEELDGCSKLSAELRFGNWIDLGNATASISLCYRVPPERVRIDLGSNVTVYLYTNISSSFSNEISIAINASNATVEIYRDGKLVLVTNTSTTWIDPIPGPHTYVFRAAIGNRSVEKSYAVHGDRYCRVVRFEVKILPRNVTSLPIAVYTNNTFSISNPANLSDLGRLEVFIANLSVFEPVGNDTRPSYSLAQSAKDLVLLANETKLLPLPFNLSISKGANVTAMVWVDNASTGRPQLRRFSIEVGNPFLQPSCDLIVKVIDDEGNPIEGANVSFANLSATTDASGIAVLRNVYPAGPLTVRYGNHTLRSWILGCGNHTIIIDTHPPRLLNVSVKPCEVAVRAIDSYSYVYVMVNGTKFGPFNGTYAVHLEPGKYRLCVVDEYGNEGNCTTVEIPPEPRHRINYALLSLYILLVGCVTYVAIALIARSTRYHVI